MDQHHPYGETAARNGASLTMRTEALHEAAARTPLPLASIGSTLVVVVGFWLWLSIPVLHLADGGTGWNTSLRDEALAVAVILAGLTLRLHPRSTVGAIAAGAAGLVLVGCGAWAPHADPTGAVNEVATGVLAVAAATLARGHR